MRCFEKWVCKKKKKKSGSNAKIDKKKKKLHELIQNTSQQVAKSYKICYGDPKA